MQYRLDEIFDLQMGKTPARNNSAYWDAGTHKWISIGDLSGCGKYISDTKESISDRAVQESGISEIPANTVVMSFKLSIGKTAITSEPIYSNEAIMSFRDKHVTEIFPDYIYYLFTAKDWESGTNKAVMGKTLNKATLSTIKINVPSIARQKEVAAILDKVSLIIDVRKNELQQLNTLIKARFVEMFEQGNDWDCCELSQCCINPDNIKCGPFGSQLHAEDYISNGIPVYGIPEVNSGFKTSPRLFISESKAESLSAYSLQAGDIAVSRKGNVGQAAFFNADQQAGIIHSDVLRIRVDVKKIDPVYLIGALHNSPRVKHQITMVSSGAVMPGTNVTKLKKIVVNVPPIELQRKYGSFVYQVDKSKAAVQKSLDETQLLMDSLMQQYFG